MNANHALSQLSYSPIYTKDTLAEYISWLAKFLKIKAGARKRIKIHNERTNEEIHKLGGSGWI